MPNIAVFLEQRAGELKKVGWQMISKARAITDQAGGEVWAVLLGEAGGAAVAAGQYGAHRLVKIVGGDFAVYNANTYAAALQKFCAARKPDLVLVGATALGKDLAPKLAVRLQCACLSDSVGLKYENGFEIRRPIFAGKCFIDATPRTACAVVGIRPNAFTLGAGAGGPAAEETFDAALAGLNPGAVVKEIRAGGAKKIELTEAERIVSGGRGIKGPENYKLIEELAAALGAAAGASRAIVDAGWVEYSHQVGQTGKTVGPNLYLACGISGAIQHLAGMSSSKCIVAVNKDANAPIFKVADYGIVGDLFQVVPALTTAIREMGA